MPNIVEADKRGHPHINTCDEDANLLIIQIFSFQKI